jgi:hypothetical protein
MRCAKKSSDESRKQARRLRSNRSFASRAPWYNKATLRAEDEDLRHAHFGSLITNAITRGYGDRTTIAAAHADRNIRINAVCPGIVDTEMMARFSGDTREGRRAVIAQEPVGRMARPEEIAATVVWLCSDAGTSSSGLHLFVDGGQTT